MATERLARLPDGRLLYRLQHRWRDGTSHVVFDPLELEKLAALVPPPRFHLVRYHGIFGTCASARDLVVPGAGDSVAAREAFPVLPAGGDPSTPGSGAHPGGQPVGPPRSSAPQPASEPASLRGARTLAREETGGMSGAPRSRRLSWPELMRRVFAIDVLECPRCSAAMEILAAIHPPETTAAILACLDLPTRAPPTEPALPEAEPTHPSAPD